MNGKLIALEGIDGSGTTTQRALVAARLRELGKDVLETKEPSDGPIGRLARSLLVETPGQPRTVDQRCLGLLFAADRLEHLDREILPAMCAGKIVLCDRYVMSSWVYQSIDCELPWIQTINSRAIWPDLTLVFDLPAETAMKRTAARRASTGEPVEIFDNEMTQLRLAEGYRKYLNVESADISGRNTGWISTPVGSYPLRDVVRVNGSNSIEKVTDDIISIIKFHCELDI